MWPNGSWDTLKRRELINADSSVNLSIIVTNKLGVSCRWWYVTRKSNMDLCSAVHAPPPPPTPPRILDGDARFVLICWYIAKWDGNNKQITFIKLIIIIIIYLSSINFVWLAVLIIVVSWTMPLQRSIFHLFFFISTSLSEYWILNHYHHPSIYQIFICEFRRFSFCFSTCAFFTLCCEMNGMRFGVENCNFDFCVPLTFV